MTSVLFVCLGNICRSPCAEGVLLHLLKAGEELPGVRVESCGLGDWHEGQLPDERMRHTAEARGVVLSSRARGISSNDFDEFDYILAADNNVRFELHKWAETVEHKAKIHLITKYSSIYQDQEIPDPFYLDQGYFELVMDMVEDACNGLLGKLIKKDI